MGHRCDGEGEQDQRTERFAVCTDILTGDREVRSTVGYDYTILSAERFYVARYVPGLKWHYQACQKVNLIGAVALMVREGVRNVDSVHALAEVARAADLNAFKSHTVIENEIVGFAFAMGLATPNPRSRAAAMKHTSAHSPIRLGLNLGFFIIVVASFQTA